jgi:multidrug resistance protein, MATE family
MSIIVGHAKIKESYIGNSSYGKDSLKDHPEPYQENISLWEAICNSLKNAFPIFITMLIAKIATISSFNFLKDYPDENVLAAYGIGNGFLNVICYAIIYSLCMGLLTRLGQAVGDKAFKLLGYYLHRGFIINCLSFIFMSVIIFFSDAGFKVFNYTDQLSTETRTYLIWSLPGIFFYMIFTTLQYYLLSINIVLPTAVMQVISAPIYIGSAYYLTSLNNYGLIGSAIALLIQNGASSIMVIAYIIYKKPNPESLFFFDKHSFEKLWDLFKHEFLIGSVVFIQWIGVEIIVLASGSLDVSQTTGLTATYMMNQTFYMIPCSLDNAVVTFVASSMGARQPKKAKKYIIAVVILGTFLASVLGILAYFFWEYIIVLLVETKAAEDYSTILIHIYLLCIVPDFLQIVLSASLRAVDKKVEGFIVTCVSMYAIAIPCAFVLCFTYDWQVEGLIWGIDIGFFCCFTINVMCFLTVDLKKQSKKIYKKILEDKAHINIKTPEVYDEKGDYNKLIED